MSKETQTSKKTLYQAFAKHRTLKRDAKCMVIQTTTYTNDERTIPHPLRGALKYLPMSLLLNWSSILLKLLKTPLQSCSGGKKF